MSEAEVSLRLAFHLLSHSRSNRKASVAIDGAQVQLGQRVIFPVSEFLQQEGWRLESDDGRGLWQGRYRKADQMLTISSRPGTGDVVAEIGNYVVRAECKKGPLARKPSNPGYPLLRQAIGQLMSTENVGFNDILLAAVPMSPAFESLAQRWRRRPLIRKAGIHLVLVNRDGRIDGLPFSLQHPNGELPPADPQSSPDEIRRLLNGPIHEQILADGITELISGEPGEVMIHISPARIRVSEYARAWDGPCSSRLKPRLVASFNRKRIPETRLLSLLAETIDVARQLRLGRFRQCRRCARHTPPEEMCSRYVCQTCAETQEGAIF